jgi:hypothetical protein
VKGYETLLTTTAGLNVAEDGGRAEEEDEALDVVDAVRSVRLSCRMDVERVGEWECANPVRVRGSTGRGTEEDAREGEEDMIMEVSGRYGVLLELGVEVKEGIAIGFAL